MQSMAALLLRQFSTKDVLQISNSCNRKLQSLELSNDLAAGSPVRPLPRGSKQLGGSGAPLPTVPPLQLQQQHVPAQPSGRAATPDLGLPDGDDLLGLTAVTPGDSKDVAAQAAEMFRALNPYSQQQQQQGGAGGSRCVSAGAACCVRPATLCAL